MGQRPKVLSLAPSAPSPLRSFFSPLVCQRRPSWSPGSSALVVPLVANGPFTTWGERSLLAHCRLPPPVEHPRRLSARGARRLPAGPAGEPQPAGRAGARPSGRHNLCPRAFPSGSAGRDGFWPRCASHRRSTPSRCHWKTAQETAPSSADPFPGGSSSLVARLLSRIVEPATPSRILPAAPSLPLPPRPRRRRLDSEKKSSFLQRDRSAKRLGDGPDTFEAGVVDGCAVFVLGGCQVQHWGLSCRGAVGVDIHE